MTTTLSDAVDSIGDIMNVTLVPFGNAAIDYETETVTCQHGESECEGNLWEMCAIDSYPDFSDHWPFYNCMEGYGSRMLDNVDTCATEAGLDYDTLSACFNDEDKAWELEQKFAALTPSYHEYTPWVEVPTGTELQVQAAFTYTVCANYEGTLPAGCPQASKPAPCMKNAKTA